MHRTLLLSIIELWIKRVALLRSSNAPHTLAKALQSLLETK
jgi:hypothetical protein